MDRRSKVELYEDIRREFEFGIGTVRGVARALGVHRRMVRDALDHSVPSEREYGPRTCPVLDPLKEAIDEILRSDKGSPRKQRHTAHRIWDRLGAEHPEFPVGESTVRAYVRERKRALSLLGTDVWVPQCYGLGEEGQVDWYEAYVDFEEERRKVQVFALRSMASGAAFHRAYLRATQQAFLEAHERAFAYFGGVFRILRYDNLASAVKKVLRGHTREEHTRFVAFRSHWRFASEFCSPGQPQEKGGIEGEAGTFRRNHLVPVPRVADLSALNEHLLAGCREDERRVVGDRQQRVGELLLAEREHLLPLAREGFDLSEAHAGIVDGKGCVKTHTNWYSTPLAAHSRAEVRVGPSVVEVWQGGRRVACHERSYDRGAHVLDLEHYLEALERKPGALAGSRPLAQWRAQGRWPASFDRLWERLKQRHGHQSGTQAMVELLLAGRDEGWEALRRAVERAVSLGCTDASAVRYLLLHPDTTAAPIALSLGELGVLSRYERPLPQMSSYDLLLSSPWRDVGEPLTAAHAAEAEMPQSLGGAR